METNQVVRSTCGICYNGCGMLVHLKDGKPIKVTGDPESPISNGVLCSKGKAALEYLNHPERLKHPLKRVGDRGENKWKHITWDEALNTIAEQLTRIKSDYGEKSLALIRGGAKGYQDGWLARFGNVFGTPNIASMAPYCFVPTRMAAIITNGYLTFPDYQYPPSCLIIWGANSANCHIEKYQELKNALDNGTKLVVIDPRKSELCQKADFWLRVRPGADLALALAMINVVINEELYDKDFVEKWTTGFDKLKAHVQSYAPESMAEITWVDADTIREAARLYATAKSACIESGNGIEHNINSFQTGRALSILRGITGNIGIPGGDLSLVPPGILLTTSPQIDLQDKISVDKRNERLSAGDNLLPIVFYALPQRIVKAIITGEPYPVHALFIQGGNVLLTYPNAHETYKALNSVDFLVVTDLFLTPTANLADIVLPVASFLEFNSIVLPWQHPVAQIQQKVAEVGESWSDYQILKELAKKLGLGEYFWEEDEKALDTILEPAGMTFKEFRRIGAISGDTKYRSYQINGFNTPSTKVELFSCQLEEWGFDPMPVYHELPETPYSNPELARDYPFLFTTWKMEPYRHSGGKQITSLRRIHPEPRVRIHPETASKLGIKEGEWVFIETKRGKIKQKAKLLDSLDTRVAGVDYGWWFPEQGAASQYGWTESNVNILTENEPPYSLEVGSVNFRGVLCKISKVA